MAMKNHLKRSVTRLVIPTALIMALTACGLTNFRFESVDITQTPNQSSSVYLMKAENSQGSLQNDWLVMALKAAVNEKNIAQAQSLSNRLSKQQLTDQQRAEWLMAQAQMAINLGQYQQALRLLNFPSQWQLRPHEWAEYYQMRADCNAVLSRYFESSRELIFLSKYVNASQQKFIAERIWENLDRYDENNIVTLSASEREKELQGWLELATYMKTLRTNVPYLKSTLEQWFSINPTHPAASYTPPSIQNILDLEVKKPNKTALLLPLSGKFAQQAQKIRDGFAMAMMNDANRPSDAALTIIDVNENNIHQSYEQLIENNVDFIIGPLIKTDIESLTQLQKTRLSTIPMLALNIPEYIDPSLSACYIALSPEQEAEQAAKHIFKLGYQHPVVLAPQSSYGERVARAFTNEWNRHSTTSPSISLFGKKQDLQHNINSVFGLQKSQRNIAQINSITGVNTESQPRSRRDIDAVYAAASNDELALIKPFIEVAINPRAKPPKIFSSSRANANNQLESNTAKYDDLIGVIYSDIPLLINPSPEMSDQMQQIWPNDTNAERRLHALGMDAYHLIEALPQMKTVNGYSFNGLTGRLSIDDQCVVQRELSWAEYGKR